MKNAMLTLNAGSSSLKFALFDIQGGGIAEAFRGQVEGLHGEAAEFSVKAAPGSGMPSFAPRPTVSASHVAALHEVLDFVHQFGGGRKIVGVGHRIVHGGTQFTKPIRVYEDELLEMRTLIPLAPLHQTHNIRCILAARKVFPEAVQVACFDTAFHRTHNWENDTFGLPPEYYDSGVRRYGFHGLSYEHLVDELRGFAPDIAEGRVIMAHLGNGASMCAMKDGRSISSTMSFTPLDGLAMGTRCGQIDAGVVLHLLTDRRMSVDAVTQLLHRGSGLKGMSGFSHDVRDLEKADTPGSRAALTYFVHRARYEIGALTALLGGLDALVFSGGIGEHAADLRKRICAGFEWLGLSLDAERNARTDRLLSADASRVKVFVVAANEEKTIAQHTLSFLPALQESRYSAP
ncbi:acetate/propionate family kinase [Rhodomicrobium vannielii ATCC 17100]|uniref:acetate/propionate family kinase n=1 Tax=Rhodomicrobium vannielii TaxID=1069 RepID=UPI00191B8EBA|nr:acetate/propionate family kinase [Rhodomicrobium vannielii]MBJ7535148.1 acetate/propionate family kinase [Rhodomicrobium vannielii ATCC 17100]